ncbi:MAG TPA: zf-HC2 domain-containing protein [Bryobacteraceae bacterium]
MNCADLEILYCDYLDGTLAPGQRAEVERHIAGCAGCAALARDISSAIGLIERAAVVEPPPELMTRILFELPSAHHARPRQPEGLRRFVRGWLQPVLQPRFAMGFAMTILSFSLLGRFAGISPRQITLDDLRPAKVWQSVDDKIYRGWQRTVKFYENLRFVYEIQTQLRDWRQKEQELKGAAAASDTPVAGRAAGSGEAVSGRAAGGEPQTPGNLEKRTNKEDLRKQK